MSEVEIFNCVHCGNQTNEKEEFRSWREEFIEAYSEDEFQRVEYEIHRYHRDDEYYSGVCFDCAELCTYELRECDRWSAWREKGREMGREMAREMDQLKKKIETRSGVGI